MDPIKINKTEVLILKTDVIMRPDEIKAIRKDIIRQIEEGVAIIPAFFSSYAILNRAESAQEGE